MFAKAATSVGAFAAPEAATLLIHDMHAGRLHGNIQGHVLGHLGSPHRCHPLSECTRDALDDSGGVAAAARRDLRQVSTERQEREQTIDSQLDALRGWAAGQGHELKAEHVFIDEGYSGSRLDRPALDRLRDAAREGEFDVVAVSAPTGWPAATPTRSLLLEEFRRAGCDVEFVHRPISDDPHDQLLLQIQGAVAEYERAVLGERFRRGKLQKARAGHWLGGRPPTATATSRAATACRATWRSTRPRPRWSGCSTAG